MPEQHGTIERIDPNLSPREFFSRYVSTRKPVVITGLLCDPDFHGKKWTNLSYLAQKAGDVKVMVEPIHPTAQQFGTNVGRIPMSFHNFIELLQSENGPHPYLTTQYSEDDPDTETTFPPPTNTLKDEFPTVPLLMGNLFLQQVNLWLGRSKHGSSSGLHHDFHENLYCLLQGRKRFVLFPPSEVKNLAPYGTLDTLHPNGLIAYIDMPVRADGLSERAACKARVGALELKIAALKGKGKDKSMSREMKALTAAHDEALDKLAMAALDEQEGEDDVDDFDALMYGLEEGDDIAAEQEDEWKGIRHSDNSVKSDSGSESSSDESGNADDDDSQAGPTDPSSFSRIPTAHLHQHLSIPTTAVLPADFSLTEYPGLYKATAPYIVELSAGEMLYLPASWWHEVTSTSTSTSSNDGNTDGNVHMAFNYWFYPPDALDNFETPYSDALVWEYLREKSKKNLVETMAQTAHAGKRDRYEEDKGRNEKNKKARC